MAETWTVKLGKFNGMYQVVYAGTDELVIDGWFDEPDARLIAAAPKMAAEAQALLDVMQNVMERGFVEIPGMEILREAMEPLEALLASIQGETE